MNGDFSKNLKSEGVKYRTAMETFYKKMTKIDIVDNFTLKTETDNITIAPGETVTLISEFTEVRRYNDHMVSTFLAPTKNPRIHVNATKFEYILDFGVLAQQTSKSAVSSMHTLNGVYFPPSNIRIRWWPKGESAEPSE